ncbi:MAG: CRISPR system precrRNA processing endoribonuclease RAMP protein Cas6 [Cyanobacteria bacterium]|nr:CRISPR system precrRNA processing endoribonuclease RAMP protein Cas6 [Cyanobacteriota bacterium]
MLRRLQLEYLLAPEFQVPLESFLRKKLGSIFHGLWMEEMANRVPEYFEQLHQPGSHLKPFKLSWPQWNPKQGTAIFTVTSLTEAYSDYLEHWVSAPTQEIQLHQMGHPFQYVKHSLSDPISYVDFTHLYYGSAVEPSPGCTLQFQSPTTFKSASNGSYYPLPDPRLILQSGINKWNAFATGISLDDPELLSTLIQYIRFGSMEILGDAVSVDKGRRIPCFRGHCEFTLSGPPALRNLITLILQYQTYCGIGAKAQMGLGDLSLVMSEIKPKRIHQQEATTLCLP